MVLFPCKNGNGRQKLIGYNKHAGTNAREIVPVTDYSEVSVPVPN